MVDYLGQTCRLFKIVLHLKPRLRSIFNKLIILSTHVQVLYVILRIVSFLNSNVTGACFVCQKFVIQVDRALYNQRIGKSSCEFLQHFKLAKIRVELVKSTGSLLPPIMQVSGRSSFRFRSSIPGFRNRVRFFFRQAYLSR